MHFDFMLLWLTIMSEVFVEKISSRFIFLMNMFTVMLVCTEHLEKQNPTDLAKRRYQTPWEHPLSFPVTVRASTLIEYKTVIENQSTFSWSWLLEHAEPMAWEWYIIMQLCNSLQKKLYLDYNSMLNTYKLDTRQFCFSWNLQC